MTWQFVVGHGTASPLIGYGSLPDFDGDGRGDIAITNTSDTDYYNTGSLLDKSASIFRVHPSTSGPVRDQKFYTAGSIYFATQFRNVGDVDGDGYADAVTRNDSMTVGSPANVTLYRGGPNGLVSGSSRQIGIVSYVLPALEWAGDVNGDGYADVGALTTDQSHYFLVLIRGGPNGLEVPDAAIDVGQWDLYYDTIHGLGDVNGDGFADVAVSNFGQVKVFLGSATGFPSTPSYFFNGRSAAIRSATSMTTAGPICSSSRSSRSRAASARRCRRRFSSWAGRPSPSIRPRVSTTHSTRRRHPTRVTSRRPIPAPTT